MPSPLFINETKTEKYRAKQIKTFISLLTFSPRAIFPRLLHILFSFLDPETEGQIQLAKNKICFDCSFLACEQAHLWVTRESGDEQCDPAGRSLVKRRQESEPALISVIFSFLLRLIEVKYHWSKSGKGEKTVNLLCFMRSN